MKCPKCKISYRTDHWATAGKLIKVHMMLVHGLVSEPAMAVQGPPMATTVVKGKVYNLRKRG